MDSTAALIFLLVLVSLKLLELETRRDYIVAALLGYFLVLSGFFFNQSLLLAIYTAFALVLNTLALAMACGAAPARPSLRLAVSLCRRLCPSSFILFIFFPRLEAQFSLFSARGRAGQLGMNDRLAPGPAGPPRRKRGDRVSRRTSGRPAIQSSNLYWRGPVLAQCEGLSWSAVVLQIDPPAKLANTSDSDLGGKIVSQRITLEPHRIAGSSRSIGPSAHRPRTSFRCRWLDRVPPPVTRKFLYNVISRLPYGGRAGFRRTETA